MITIVKFDGIFPGLNEEILFDGWYDILPIVH